MHILFLNALNRPAASKTAFISAKKYLVYFKDYGIKKKRKRKNRNNYEHVV